MDKKKSVTERENEETPVGRVRRVGGVGVPRTLRSALSFQCVRPWDGDSVVVLLQRVSQGFGVAALAIAAMRREKFLAVAGMMFLAGNMMYYGVL